MPRRCKNDSSADTYSSPRIRFNPLCTLSMGAPGNTLALLARRERSSLAAVPTGGEIAAGTARLQADSMPLVHPVDKRFGLHRLRDKIALPYIAAEVAQHFPVVLSFYALRYRGDIQPMGHLQARFQDQTV